MSTLTLLRLYLRHQSMPRVPLPCIGYAGILYSSPLIDQQKYLVKDESGRSNGSPETTGLSKIVLKKGSMGSYFFRRGYCTTVEDIKKAEKGNQEKTKFKLKTQDTIKVMVLSDNNSYSAMTLEEANKLAKKKSMTLVHVTDSSSTLVKKTKKEIYKLVSRSASVNMGQDDEALTKNSDNNNEIKQKEVKTLLLKSNIGAHDRDAKVNGLKKWVKKGHRVRVIISQNSDKGNAEDVFKEIEEQLKELESQIQQKIKKGNEIRFYVAPKLEEKRTSNVGATN